MEIPTVTNTDKGIEFGVTGLSPISAGWTAPTSTPAPTPSTPATGATAPVVALTLLAALLLCYKKRRA